MKNNRQAKIFSKNLLILTFSKVNLIQNRKRKTNIGNKQK